MPRRSSASGWSRRSRRWCAPGGSSSSPATACPASAGSPTPIPRVTAPGCRTASTSSSTTSSRPTCATSRAARSEIVTAGASLGALYALAAVCRHPDVFSHAVCMSGKYDLEEMLDGERMSLDFYYSSPLHFLPDLEDAAAPEAAAQPLHPPGDRTRRLGAAPLRAPGRRGARRARRAAPDRRLGAALGPRLALLAARPAALSRPAVAVSGLPVDRSAQAASDGRSLWRFRSPGARWTPSGTSTTRSTSAGSRAPG